MSTVGQRLEITSLLVHFPMARILGRDYKCPSEPELRTQRIPVRKR